MRKLMLITSLMFCFSFGLWADAFYYLSIKYPLSIFGKGKIPSYGAIGNYAPVTLSSQGLHTNNTSGWKKAGIYGAEFVTGGIVSTAFAVIPALPIIFSGPPDNPIAAGAAYASGRFVGDILVTAPVVHLTGKLFGQKGSIGKAMMGTGVGNVLSYALGFVLDYLFYQDGEYQTYENVVVGGVYLSLPSLGAVIGNNLYE